MKIENLSSLDAWHELLMVASAADTGDTEASERTEALISLLQGRGESEVVQWALPLLAEEPAWRRSLAASVLSQHGYREGRPFGPQVASALAVAARCEEDEDARVDIVSAIGNLENPAWVPELLRYVDDPSPGVREMVASSLPFDVHR